MYYILNETKQIVAADDSLLNLCGVAHINELASSIAKGDTTFDLISDTSVNIRTEDHKESYIISETSLSSMLGQLTLINLTVDADDSTDESSDFIDSIIHEEKTSSEKLEIKDDDEITFGDHLSLSDDTMDLSEEIGEETSIDKETVSDILNESELFDLVLDDDKEEKNDTLETLDNKIDDEPLDDIPLSLELDHDLFLDTDIAVDTSEISINVEEISQNIGISVDDYNGFLNDFIDTALGLEKDLQSNDEETRSSAIGTLSHLSDVLHLPVIGDIITNIADSASQDQREVIESFYATLSRLTATSSSDKETSTTEEEELELFDDPVTIDEPIIQEEIKPKKLENSESFGTISLEGINPKHFDFQLEEAANELSLPVELIEEFVHDFIDQAHIETKKMLEAYEKGDLDAIQKIGHLLKGASSNLRINPLSDTLYKIQFCEDNSQLEALIKDYWAHFLSFENQINVISK